MVFVIVIQELHKRNSNIDSLIHEFLQEPFLVGYTKTLESEVHLVEPQEKVFGITM